MVRRPDRGRRAPPPKAAPRCTPISVGASCGLEWYVSQAQRGGRIEIDLREQHDAGPAHQAAKVNTQTGVAGRQAFRVRREPGGEEA